MKTEKRFALLRIAFGCVWAIDAYFKWTPEVRDNMIGLLTETLDGQPAWEAWWIHTWVHIANIDPPLFGILIAIIQTALAVSLIFGVFSRLALWCGLVFALLIWSVPEGFGGPYGPGSTDLGSGIMYALLFVALIIGNAWHQYRIDSLLRRN